MSTSSWSVVSAPGTPSSASVRSLSSFDNRSVAEGSDQSEGPSFAHYRTSLGHASAKSYRSVDLNWYDEERFNDQQSTNEDRALENEYINIRGEYSAIAELSHTESVPVLVLPPNINIVLGVGQLSTRKNGVISDLPIVCDSSETNQSSDEFVLTPQSFTINDKASDGKIQAADSLNITIQLVDYTPLRSFSASNVIQWLDGQIHQDMTSIDQNAIASADVFIVGAGDEEVPSSETQPTIGEASSVTQGSNGGVAMAQITSEELSGEEHVDEERANKDSDDGVSIEEVREADKFRFP